MLHFSVALPFKLPSSLCGTCAFPFSQGIRCHHGTWLVTVINWTFRKYWSKETQVSVKGLKCRLGSLWTCGSSAILQLWSDGGPEALGMSDWVRAVLSEWLKTSRRFDFWQRILSKLKSTVVLLCALSSSVFLSDLFKKKSSFSTSLGEWPSLK